MIKQGAVRIDGERVEDRSLEIDAGTTSIYQVGKRKFARVSLTESEFEVANDKDKALLILLVMISCWSGAVPGE